VTPSESIPMIGPAASEAVHGPLAFAPTWATVTHLHASHILKTLRTVALVIGAVVSIQSCTTWMVARTSTGPKPGFREIADSVFEDALRAAYAKGLTDAEALPKTPNQPAPKP
jgi:hypothetical protein